MNDKILKECDLFVVFPSVCPEDAPHSYKFEITPIQDQEDYENYEIISFFKSEGIPLLQDLFGDFVDYIKVGAKWSEDIDFSPKKERRNRIETEKTSQTNNTVVKKKKKKPISDNNNYSYYIYGLIPITIAIGVYFSFKKIKFF